MVHNLIAIVKNIPQGPCSVVHSRLVNVSEYSPGTSVAVDLNTRKMEH